MFLENFLNSQILKCSKKVFLDKINSISNDLNINPDWLMAVIHFETNKTFDPSIKNGIGATGLIQFLPKTASLLNTTTDLLAKMRADEQLDYVKQYFILKSKSKTITSFLELYCLVFFEASFNKNLDYKFSDEVKKNNEIFARESGQDDLKKIHIKNVLKRKYPTLFTQNEEGKNKQIEQENIKQNEKINNSKVQSEKGQFDIILVTDENVTTIDDFIEKHKVFASKEELISLNEQEMKNSLSLSKKEDWRKGVFTPPISLKIPKDTKEKKTKKNTDNTVISSTNAKAFISEEISKILNSESVTQGGQIFENYSIENMNEFTVLCYSRFLNDSEKYENFDKNEKGQLINITPFIISLTTNVAENGGNFNLVLSDILLEKAKSREFDFFSFESEEGDGFLSVNSINREESIESKDFKCGDFEDVQGQKFLKRNFSLFNALFSENDIVFISFENKKVEDSVFYADLSLISDKQSWDMIGFIDTVSESTQAPSSKSLSIQGTDLSKILIDDSIYFYPFQYGVKEITSLFKTADRNKTIYRIAGNLFDDDFSFIQEHTLNDWLGYIFSELTSLRGVDEHLFSNIKNKTIAKSRKSNGKKVSQEQKGVWGIINLVIDEKIGKRKLVDSTIPVFNGSISFLIKKFCQEPFVEFFSDTYGSKFYFIVRKHPFIYDAIISNKTINIFEEDVYNDSINFSKEVYTVFRLIPTGSFMGEGGFINLVNFPGVWLDEYVEIWGLKPLDITTNYVEFPTSQQDRGNEKTDLDYASKQAKKDLEWLVQTSALLPFSREGTITVKFNRKIKKGVNIRYFPTGEVFYVESVSAMKVCGDGNYEQMTIQVKRGLVEKHLKKYFELVDSNFAVNQKTLKFFLNKRQFLE